LEDVLFGAEADEEWVVGDESAVFFEGSADGIVEEVFGRYGMGGLGLWD
jgi:hypothetical protein